MKTNSPIKWHGGKHYMIPKLLQIQEKITTPIIHRVEHFGGSLSWTLAQKQIDGVSEVVNDIHEGLTNFWDVLQRPHYFERFKRQCEATPFSEIEWQWAGGIGPEDRDDDPVDAAVAFFVRCRQSMAGRMESFTPISRTRTRRNMNEQVSAWLSSIEGLPDVHSRLKRILITGRDFEQSIISNDEDKTLHYCDPPYLHSTRKSTKVYKYEMTEQDHVRMLDTLKSCKGKVMLSGYMNDLYAKILSSWNAELFKLPNNSASGEKKRIMEEVVWYNF